MRAILLLRSPWNLMCALALAAVCLVLWPVGRLVEWWKGLFEDDWPMNEVPCDCEGCGDRETTPCFWVLYSHEMSVLEALFRVLYSHEMSVLEALFRYGVRAAVRLLRDGHVEILDGYYCAEHAYEQGFCWGRGNFYAGASERFDFRIGGQWLCDACWGNMGDELDDGD